MWPKWQNFAKSGHTVNAGLKGGVCWGTAIAQWIRLRLPSCCPGLEFQAHYQCFKKQLIFESSHIEMTKMNKTRPGLAHLKRVYVHSPWLSKRPEALVLRQNRQSVGT